MCRNVISPFPPDTSKTTIATLSVTGHILDLMQTNKKYRHQPEIV